MPVTGSMHVVMAWNIVIVISMTYMLAGMVIQVRCVVVIRGAVIGEGRWAKCANTVSTVTVADATIASADSNADSAAMAAVAAVYSVAAAISTVAAMLSAGD